MTVDLPTRARLDQPPGDLPALEDLASAVRGAADRLELLHRWLTGPAACAPGWLGEDAAAAATQIGAAARIAGNASAALAQAGLRLSSHAALVREVRARVAALRAEQEDDFGAARARLRTVAVEPLTQLPGAGATGGAMILAIGDELRAAEARRAEEHRSLLDDVAADARATAALLAACAAAVGGTGSPGDEGSVVARLAASLPGWGREELAARAAGFARLLSGEAVAERWEAQARGSLPYADNPDFAEALLADLGVTGVQQLLLRLGTLPLGPDSALAGLTATVLAAAGFRPSSDEAVHRVLTGTYLDRADQRPWFDCVAVGMATVLLAGVRSGRPVPAETALLWGRQVVSRERTLHDKQRGSCRAVDRANPAWTGRSDPVVSVVQSLVASRSAAVSAEFLASDGVWCSLLERSWPGEERSALVALVAQTAMFPGERAGAAALAGIQALGTGLGNDGNPEKWPVNRRTADAVAPALGEALGRHLAQTVPLLTQAGSGPGLDAAQTAALRGLGYLTLDPRAAAAVREGLERWAQGRPMLTSLPDGAVAASDVVPVASAVMAGQEYGQRLAYALHGFAEQARAEDRARPWTVAETIAGLGQGKVAPVVGGVLPWAAHWAGADGTWDNGRDTGARFGREDAAWWSLDRLSTAERRHDHAVAVAARTGFDLAAARLGSPRPPVSPEYDPLAQFRDSFPEPKGRKQAPEPRRTRLRFPRPR